MAYIVADCDSLVYSDMTLSDVDIWQRFDKACYQAINFWWVDILSHLISRLLLIY